MDINSKSPREFFDLFKIVNDNKSYDCYRFMADQIANSGKVYATTYDFLKIKLENGELPPEDAYVLFIEEIGNTLKSLKQIEDLIESSLGDLD